MNAHVVIGRARRGPHQGLIPQLVDRTLGWAIVGFFLVIWQFVAISLNMRSLPTFSESMRAFVDIFRGDDLTAHVLPSAQRVLTAYGIASALGVGLGLVLGHFRALGPWLRPVLEFFRQTPPALAVPAFMLLLGPGTSMELAVIVFGAFWPVLVNSWDGAARVDPYYVDAAKAAHMGRAETLLRVVLPAALPQMASGLRLALGISLIMLVIAEMVGATSGLGYLITYSQQTFRIPTTYGAVLCLAALGWVFDTVFLLLEGHVLRWSRARGGQTRGG